MVGMSDDDFDRLWDKSSKEATKRQGITASDQTDPVKHTTSSSRRRRSTVRRTRTSGSRIPKISASLTQPYHSSSEKTSSEVERGISASLTQPYHSSSEKTSSKVERGDSKIAAEKAQVFDQFRETDSSAFPPPLDTTSIGSQDRSPGVEGAFNSESLPHSKTEVASLLKGIPNIPDFQRTNSPPSMKWDTQREVAKSVLQLESTSQASLHSYTLPITFEVLAHKETRNQSSGLVLSHNQKNEICCVMVKDITPQSIFSTTALRAGHEILTINDHRVKSPQQAAKMMKSIKGGVKLLVSEGRRPPGARYVLVKTNPRRKDEGESNSDKKENQVHGIQLKTRQGLVQASHIDSGGLFANSSVYPGDIFLTVNGNAIQDGNETTKSILDHPEQGLICALVYSMLDLRVGLIGQLLSDPWESSWSKNHKEVTISKMLDDDKLDGKKGALVLSFQEDWSCRWMEPSHTLGSGVTSVERDTLENLARKVNGFLNLAVLKLKEAVIDASAIPTVQYDPQKSPKVSFNGDVTILA